MKAQKLRGFYNRVVLAFGFLIFTSSAFSATTVVPSPQDECTRTVFLEIEIFTNDENTTPDALQGMADLWEKEIESKWNGPTEEAIKEAASELGMSDEDLEQYADWNLNGFPALIRRKKQLEDKAAENMAVAGIDGSCTMVNCCKIFFHVSVRVRSAANGPTPGADQIEVKPADFRSFVRVNDEGNQKGTTGEWAFRPGDSPAAHEAGHLMGLDDHYHKETTEDGESHSVANEGHENDLMVHNNAWPKSEHLTEILRQGGHPCNCCKNTELSEAFLQDYSTLAGAARDAIAGNNCDQLIGVLQNLEEKQADLYNTKVPLANKVATGHIIQNEINRVKKALENCPKYQQQGTTGPIETIEVPDMGMGLGPGNDYLEMPEEEPSGNTSTEPSFEFVDEKPEMVPFSFDSLICPTYGGGTILVPQLGDIPYLNNLFSPKGDFKGPAANQAQGNPGQVVGPLNAYEYDNAQRVVDNAKKETPGTTDQPQYDPNSNRIPENRGNPTEDPGDKIPGSESPYDEYDRVKNPVQENPNPQGGLTEQPGVVVPEYDSNENVIRNSEDTPPPLKTPGQDKDKVPTPIIYDAEGKPINSPDEPGPDFEGPDKPGDGWTNTPPPVSSMGPIRSFDNTKKGQPPPPENVEPPKESETVPTPIIYDSEGKPINSPEHPGPEFENTEEEMEAWRKLPAVSSMGENRGAPPLPPGSPPRSPSTSVEIPDNGSIEVGQGDDVPQNQQPQSTVPSWLVFKVEQEVVTEDGKIEKKPAGRTVLKLGYPPPAARPGSNVTRTAQDTNNGATADPRFIETDENGWGAVPNFMDGFESGDLSPWPQGNQDNTQRVASRDQEKQPNSTPPPRNQSSDNQPDPSNQGVSVLGTPDYLGFSLDATPMKSRIVYIDTRFIKIDDPFYQNLGIDWDIWRGEEMDAIQSGDQAPAPDDRNGNGQPDWTEIKPGNDISTELNQMRLDTPPSTWHGSSPGVQGTSAGLGTGGSSVEETPQTAGLPDEVKEYVIDGVQFGNTLGLILGYKYYQDDQILDALSDNFQQDNSYRMEKVDDPYFQAKGTWGQPYDDQWAIKSVGFTGEPDDAWTAAGDDLEPVIVAFIDTGLDWNHADISWENIWVNEDEIPDNGIDDDYNGYVDDSIGWDFYTNSATPWDQDGHGTFTAGMIIAQKDNGTGIAGINPAAKIMILKALNDFGHTRASNIAKAIKYATDNGARIINLSVGGDHLTYLEELAVKYAYDRGVLIIVAAGNEAKEVAEYGLTPYEEVIAVASSDFEKKRAFFSNHGPEIDIAAPGLDVLSLRARMTDFMRHLRFIPYEAGTAYVGDDKRYFRSSGTSFSAPIVTGVASLILSKNPDLTNIQVKRMLLNSALDTELPGVDQFTGYGVVDAVAALNADPNFEIIADIGTVEAVQDDAGNYFVRVTGSAGANEFDVASIQIGIGETPTQFKEIGRIGNQTFRDQLALIPAAEFMTAPTWTIRLVVRHKNGKTREQWFVLQLG